jgi:TfoX/Sxy family transcriptional regulator of competence genes
MRKVRKQVTIKASRPEMFRTTDEMRRIAVMLGAELESFDDVTAKPMFGLIGYYRDRVIFAALPKTRALGSANSLIFKLNAAPERLLARARQDPRITTSQKGMKGWQTLEISSERDIGDAQRWLLEAWRYAVKLERKKAKLKE